MRNFAATPHFECFQTWKKTHPALLLPVRRTKTTQPSTRVRVYTRICWILERRCATQSPLLSPWLDSTNHSRRPCCQQYSFLRFELLHSTVRKTSTQVLTRSLTGGGPPGRNLARLKEEQGKPEWKPSKWPFKAAVKSEKKGSSASKSVPSRRMSRLMTLTLIPRRATAVETASPSPNFAGPEK